MKVFALLASFTCVAIAAAGSGEAILETIIPDGPNLETPVEISVEDKMDDMTDDDLNPSGPVVTVNQGTRKRVEGLNEKVQEEISLDNNNNNLHTA